MALLTDDLGRAVSAWANRLGFVKFYCLPVIDIGTEGLFYCIHVAVESIMRMVDDELQKLKSSAVPRADMVAIHLNRIILFLVYQDQSIVVMRSARNSGAQLDQAVREATDIAFSSVAQHLQVAHEYEYLANLCKNLSKCEALVQAIHDPTQNTGSQGSLFD